MIRTLYYKNTRLRTSKFIPIFLFNFLFILLNNLIGLIPHSYALTSLLILDFYLISSMFAMINLIGIIYHKWNFFGILMPKGVPLILAWFLIFFETISYLVRVISLTVRLFANILSGHILQHILMSFVFQLSIHNCGFVAVFALLPWFVVFAVTCLEIAICCLQAYVLIALILIYFGNVINLH